MGPEIADGARQAAGLAASRKGLAAFLEIANDPLGNDTVSGGCWAVNSDPWLKTGPARVASGSRFPRGQVRLRLPFPAIIL